MDGVLGPSAAPSGGAILAAMTMLAAPPTAAAVSVRPVDPLGGEDLVGIALAVEPAP